MTRKATRTQIIVGCAAVMLVAVGVLGQATGLDSSTGILKESTALTTHTAVPLRADLDEYLEDFHKGSSHGALAPNPLDHNDIRPGQRILVDIPNEGLFICSISFLFNDLATSRPIDYAGTAGHCLMPPSEIATHGEPGGNNYDASGVKVFVCNNGCLFGGQLSGFGWDSRALGEVTYARQTDGASDTCPAGGVGNDFGLIKIPDRFDTDPNVNVNPAMAVWHGPTGQNSFEGTGNPLVHYGNGITAGTTFATGGRTAVSLNDGIPCSFMAAGHVSGGDSGSAISFAGVSSGPVLHGEEALGTITHTLGIVVPFGTPILGTTIDRGIEMADDDAGIDIALVLP